MLRTVYTVFECQYAEEVRVWSVVSVYFPFIVCMWTEVKEQLLEISMDLRYLNIHLIKELNTARELVGLTEEIV